MPANLPPHTQSGFLPLHSRMPGIDWPALLGAPGEMLLSLLWQLDSTQWLDAQELRKHQATQLAELLHHATANVPFYRERLRGIDPQHAATSAGWQAIPILKRAELQQAGQSIVAQSMPPSHGRMSQSMTSGSTGQPVTVYGTHITALFWSALYIRFHLWHQHDFSAKLATVRVFPNNACAPPAGVLQPGWGAPVDLLFKSAPCALLSIASTITAQADWLTLHDPAYLLTYPSNLVALVQEMRRRQLRPASLRKVWTISETLHSQTRELVQQAWGVPVVDTYSSQECGYIAMQCPESGLYHIQSESVLVEVLDSHDQPCRPGEIGRLVVTPLHNFAAPLIRYEIGDYAEAGEPCPCGRGLPTLRRIMGRERNMLRLPGGESRWPLTGYQEFSKAAPIRQFQMVQKSLEQIEARFVVERALSKEEESAVLEIVRQALGYPFDIHVIYLPELPRSASGKFEEFISEIQQGKAP